MAVWEEGNNIYATYYNKGSNQWEAVEMIDNLSGSARNPQVAFGPTGSAIAVWSQDDSGSIESIFFNLYEWKELTILWTWTSASGADLVLIGS